MRNMKLRRSLSEPNKRWSYVESDDYVRLKNIYIKYNVNLNLFDLFIKRRVIFHTNLP